MVCISLYICISSSLVTWTSRLGRSQFQDWKESSESLRVRGSEAESGLLVSWVVSAEVAMLRRARRREDREREEDGRGLR
jgi:hypothetical protein